MVVSSSLTLPSVSVSLSGCGVLVARMVWGHVYASSILVALTARKGFIPESPNGMAADFESVKVKVRLLPLELVQVSYRCGKQNSLQNCCFTLTGSIPDWPALKSGDCCNGSESALHAESGCSIHPLPTR